MRKAVPYLLLLMLAYGAWHYWQQRPRHPVQTLILPLDPERVESFVVQLPKQAKLRFSRNEGAWIAEYPSHTLAVAAARPDSLLTAISKWRSNGMLTGTISSDDYLGSVEMFGTDFREAIHFFAAPDSLPQRVYLQRGERPDFFIVEPLEWKRLPLRFADYANFTLVDLSRFSRLDSVIWVTDSIRRPLLMPADSLRLDSLRRAWHPLRGQHFAHAFDEVSGRDKRSGAYRLYGDGDSLELIVYRDTLWATPYVLSSGKFPPVYFATEELPLPIAE